jgi:hypothetical protein
MKIDRKGYIHGRCPSSSRCPLVRETLYCVSLPHDIHEGHARNLTYPAAQLAIAGCDDVALVRRNALDETVVGVCAPVCACKALEARVACYSVRELVRAKRLTRACPTLALHDNDARAFPVPP